MKFSDMKESKFIKQADVDPAREVTIEKFDRINIAMDGQEEELCWTVWFKEFDKPMVLKPLNLQMMASLFNDDVQSSIGKKIILYREPNVMMGGKLVGGIRIRPVAEPVQSQSVQQPLQSHTDMLMAYASLPKPSPEEQGFIKSICLAAFNDHKCEVKNRVLIWNYINEKRWPMSIEEADSLAAQLKLLGDAGDSEIPF